MTGPDSDSEAAPREIERKYLLRGLPDEARARGVPKEIEQGWIPGTTLQERLRRVRAADGSERRFRTVKLGRGVSRIEVEEETPADLFERMWPLTEGRRVHKRRWVVESGERRWEIDEFLDRSLVLAEIELEREDEPVVLPEWLAPWVVREVTGEDAYVNVNLAR
ncbi:MAG: adenylate cyclase [Myxococcaceae bacterium]|nr:adenylate cyclase [Myxococcaceae bacterium]